MRELKYPFAISLLGMVAGVFIAILFGINEDIFKSKITNDLKQHPKYSSFADPAEQKAFLKKEKDKNWRYYQRFHFHSTGIAAMSLGALLLLGFMNGPGRKFPGYLIAVGGFLYPFVWLFAAMYGPTMGRGAAKETFAIFGYMGGLFLVGILWQLILLLSRGLKD